MVEFLSPDLLRREVGQLPITEEAMVRKAQQRSPSGSVFLSHSTADGDRLPYVIAILERHGAEVYVDKKDTTLPAFTSRGTAEGLKSRIKSSKKFILVTSPTSKDSRWMPWELGLADGFKGLGNVAVLPSPEDSRTQTWASQEYLGVYDRIVFGKFGTDPKSTFRVYNQETKRGTKLADWLGS